MEGVKKLHTTEVLLQSLIEKVDNLANESRFNKEYLTMHEASEYLGVGYHTLLRWSNLGLIPVSKPFSEIAKSRSKSNSSTYVKKSDLIDLLERNRGKSPIATDIEIENRMIDRMFARR